MHDLTPVWSPAGEEIAFLSDRTLPSAPAFESHLFIAQVGVSGSLQLSPAEVTGFDWSPDGTRLAFTSIRDGNIEMYVMNDDGSGVQRLTNDPGEDWVGAWSPDGTRLAFQTNRDGNWEIYTINVDGIGLTNLTLSPAQETSPAWR